MKEERQSMSARRRNAMIDRESPADLKMHLAYAEASVMLVECLMLVLMEKKVLPIADLVDVVETAIEAKQQLVTERSHPEIATIAAGVLSKIANSLAAGHQ